MKKLILLLIFTSVEAQAWQEVDMTINANGHKIHGSLSKPKDSKNNKNQDTVILFIAGSGPTDRDGNQSQVKTDTYLMIAQALYEKGFATLRYDKRGVGASTEPQVIAKDLRFEHYVDDAVLWVEELSKQFKHVVLMGHSIGGLMSLQVAQKSDDKAYPVKSVITLAAMASSGYDTLNRQLSNQPEFVKEAALPLLERLSKDNEIPEKDIPPFLFGLFHPNLQGFLKSFLHIQPAAELSEVKQDVLVIIGETDIQITVEETEKMVKGNQHAQLVKIPEMNHVLKVAPIEQTANMATYSQPDLPLHPDLMPLILAFLKK